MLPTFPTLVATLAPVFNCVQLFPQLYKTYTTRKVDDLSFYSLVLLFTTNLLWVLHGYFIMDLSLMVAGVISMAVNFSLILLYLRFYKNVYKARFCKSAQNILALL